MHRPVGDVSRALGNGSGGGGLSRSCSPTPDVDAVRDALCSRIRTLGESIKAIAEAAAEEVRRLDDMFAEEQRVATAQESLLQQRRSASPRPAKPIMKAARTSKTGSVSLGRGQLPPNGGSRLTSGAEAANGAVTPTRAASLRSSTPPAESSPRRASARVATKRKSLKAKTPSPPPPVEPDDSAVAGADAREQCDAGARGTGGGRRAAEDAAAAAAAALCAAAEANYQRVLADSASTASACDGNASAAAGVPQCWRRGAPLYDASNAAISSQRRGAEVNTAAWAGATAAPSCDILAGAVNDTEDDDGDPHTTPVLTAGGAPTLSARCQAAAAAGTQLSEQAEQQALAALHAFDVKQQQQQQQQQPDADGTTSASNDGCEEHVGGESVSAASSPVRSYFNVVYIHQSTGPRRGSNKADAPPATISSHVQALYEVDGADAHAAPASMPPPASQEGDAALVRLELRVPAHRPRAAPSPLHVVPAVVVSTPTAAHSSSAVDRQSEQTTDTAAASSVSIAAPLDDCPSAHAAAGGDGAASATAAEAQYAARIESIEDWQRDRHATVEDRIRRRRRSSIMGAGWRGEYYCYSVNVGAGTTAATPDQPTSPDAAEHTHHRDPLLQQQQQQPQQQLQQSPYLVSASPTTAGGAATRYSVLLPVRRESPTPSRSASEAATAAAVPVASSPATPAQRSGAAARERRPRLEVVVSSSYNSVEWAFAGAARRASATTAVEDDALQGRGGGGRAPLPDEVPPSLLAAHQQRELELEERRRWNARTREPHGVDIHTPIDVLIQ
ncbi:hypothetical protein NESM_000252100 [Novymonas esmeraldas]|uniref:Uncharacterized protein n=1 Tax=Novymonas esmeraldas TaxID=1808958 RepID=A0AAW0F5J8_9TRYP